MSDQATLEWWLVRACASYETGRNRGIGDEDMDVAEWNDGDPENYDNTEVEDGAIAPS